MMIDLIVGINEYSEYIKVFEAMRDKIFIANPLK